MINLANHLWQSTLFAVVAIALNFLLRRHRAQTRYWIWLAASLKFLLPFSLLVSLGSQFEGRLSPPRSAPVIIRQASEPFLPVSTLPIPDTPKASLVTPLLQTAWIAGSALILGGWLIRWLRIARLRRQSTPLDISAPIPVRETSDIIEPGVFGLVRPVLLLPAGISERLTPAQLSAILDHEFCHVRRRDNLTSALHMIVQAVFWFHPLVWWLGSRLVAERENACDEDVLRLGNPAGAYAEGIVNVCRFYVEAPLPCTSGVTGADLKERITAILTSRPSRPLNLAGRLALAATATAILAVPILAGLVQNPPDTLKFEVASIRVSKADNENSRLGPGPGGAFQATNVTLMHLVTFAYGIRPFQLDGLPGWARTVRFDVLAKPEQSEPPIDTIAKDLKKMESQLGNHRERVRNLLAERFQLVVNRESKEMPVFALTVAKGGHKLTQVPEGSHPPNMGTRRGMATGKAVPVRILAEAMSGLMERRVIDETGLSGVYDFEVHWTPESAPNADGPVDQSGPSLPTALQEQLGLKLESKRAPVEILTIKRLEKPSDN
jgi:uncharacterized protein (TIGR03435 family)